MPVNMTSGADTAALTFDPTTDAEWEELGALGRRMLGEMLDHLQRLPEQPAWRQMPDEIAASFDEPLPMTGVGNDSAYRAFVDRVLPYRNGNYHPRFFGWVQGNGTPYAMLADMLASGLNAHLAGFNHAPALVERQVVKWFAELMGMPNASGLFVTGGTMANTLGMAVARYAAGRKANVEVRRLGVQAWPGESATAPFVFYGSTETHGWATKAAEWLGLGDRAFRRVPVDAEYRIDLLALDRQIADDRASGLQPFCIIGTAGTVNTGATDDLVAIADICARESLWFHVDGAFGAMLKLSPKLAHIVDGLERADSVGFDLHKWGSMPFDNACVLIRDAALHHEAFRTTASYLPTTTRGVSAGGVYFAERGLDLTRSFKALKTWMSLKADGIEKHARIIEQNVDQLQYLVRRVQQDERLELLAPAPLNIACFRFVDAALDDTALDSLNQELLLRLQERGIAVPSSTTINGRFALRVAHVNHRTTWADIDVVIDAVSAIGGELLRERSA
jgi:glutamate/tyrosine decarboxylase-like PLP-dependent enzyme